jgi:ABC-type polysaccharide/polyol phosphate export permease
LNPVLQIVQDVRHSLVDAANPAIPSMVTSIGALVIVPILGTLVVLGVGFLVFNRLTPKFAEAL